MKKTVGGTAALAYALKVARKMGISPSLQALYAKNTCKSCAFGTGGQNGGIRNEAKQFPEFCKKNLQTQLSDLQAAIPVETFSQCSIANLDKLDGRLTTPLYKQAGDTHYRPISIDAALHKIAERFNNTDPQRSFFYSSGRSSNEAAFLLQLFARAWGTNHVNNCSYFCHQASGVGLTNSIGSGTATLQLHDLQQSDLIFVIGANPSSNHPRFLKELVACRRRGGQVIIINPVKEKGLVNFTLPSDWRSMLGGGSEVASVYLQPNIGADIAVLKGIAKACLAQNGQQLDFINNYTEGFAAYAADIENTSWHSITKQSGLDQATFAKVAELYLTAKKAVFAWGMGITQHLHGVDNVESIVNLALLRGMIGQTGAGLLPLRGHSNVQGVGSVGVTPALKTAVLQNIEKNLGIRIPKHNGFDTMACLEAAHDGKMDLAFILGGNLFGASPDPVFTEQALDRIPFKVYLHPTLNSGHVHGVAEEVVILPVTVRDEEKQATTQESMFNYVRISEGGIYRFPELYSEVELINKLACAVIAKDIFDFSVFAKHANIRDAIASSIPGFEAIEKREEFQIGGRTFHKPDFPTTNGKAFFRVIAIPEYKQTDKTYRMTSVRSEGQFNTIIYEQEDLYREQTDRWVVLMNAEDMQREGLEENDYVSLRNETGKMLDLKVRAYDIPLGNLLTYFPESNVLIPKTTDQRSKTPSYKSVLVELWI
jgi:molybdopterin-dependent oxidoreductase alpha subunit